MNIIRLAAEIFLIYLLYKLIFDFIIPIYQTTKEGKKAIWRDAIKNAGTDEYI